jgi:hypothetical protein
MRVGYHRRVHYATNRERSLIYHKYPLPERAIPQPDLLKQKFVISALSKLLCGLKVSIMRQAWKG